LIIGGALFVTPSLSPLTVGTYGGAGNSIDERNKFGGMTMAGFGLDNAFVKKLVSDLDVANVRQDQFSDFFILPQLDAIYTHCGDKLKQAVAAKLNASNYSQKRRSSLRSQSLYAFRPKVHP
jgi:hypothetical protein